MKKLTYLFSYNLPAENHTDGNTDHFIDCQADWIEGMYYSGNTNPVLINEGPIMSRLTNYSLMVVKDWFKVLDDIKQIASDHFMEITKPSNVVELAEQTLKVTVHDSIKF